jgi:hypothetical protein
MSLVKVTVSLPEDLVRDAREFNLLTDEIVENLLQAEVDRQVADFVNAEIKAYRAEKADMENNNHLDCTARG